MNNSAFGFDDTICAISTPPGRGGIAVIRLSGKGALPIADRVWQGRRLSDASSHSAHLGKLLDTDGRMLDQALATIFKSPRTFTGEDVVEFSVHGSTYIQAELLKSLLAAGARIAEPGEFTRRAFMNGRMDLAEAEAVADVIAAGSRAAHSIAVSQLQGAFSAHIEHLRNQLIDLAALLELELDFSEEDVAFADRSRLRTLALDIINFIDSLINTFHAGSAIRDGIPVAIVGRPNAGKSSLLNVLLGRDRAIVSDIPGTTRDTVEESVDIAGINFRFIDTAGLRHSDDPVESLGIQRSYQSLGAARIILWLLDPRITAGEITDTFQKIESSRLPDAELICLLSKNDLGVGDSHHIIDTLRSLNSDLTPIPISVITAEGIEDLRSTLTRIAKKGLPDDESMIVTNARHCQALSTARQALTDMLPGLAEQGDAYLTTDLLAEHLREAINALGSITGSITSSTILATIFSRFCIGK